MKYLVDENIASRIVAWLRNRGDDVRYASEERPGEIDAQWLHEAEAEQRLIVTSDKDFGDLVFRDRLNSHGARARAADCSIKHRPPLPASRIRIGIGVVLLASKGMNRRTVDQLEQQRQHEQVSNEAAEHGQPDEHPKINRRHKATEG